MVEHILAWRRGDLDAARKVWDRGLGELHEYVYSESSRLHVRYKVATWLRGFIATPLMRPPFPLAHASEVLALQGLLERTRLDVIDKESVDRFISTLPR